MPHKSMDVSYWINTFKSIGIGTTGGFIAYKLNMPLPWLLGALFLNFFFSFSKIKLEFSKKLLNPIFLIMELFLEELLMQHYSIKLTYGSIHLLQWFYLLL